MRSSRLGWNEYVKISSEILNTYCTAIRYNGYEGECMIIRKSIDYCTKTDDSALKKLSDQFKKGLIENDIVYNFRGYNSEFVAMPGDWIVFQFGKFRSMPNEEFEKTFTKF